MNIIAVDDEHIALMGLTDAITKAVPSATVHSFSRSKQVLEYIKFNTVDIAFLDIMINESNGLEIGEAIQKSNPRANIIFVTGYNHFAGDAYKMLASGYIIKPVGVEDIVKQINNLRYEISSEKTSKSVRIQCFGNFEVFINNEPVAFHYSKSKEILAYLIDRKGTLCTNKEIIAKIWEDDVKESYYQNIRRDLLSTLPKNIFRIQKGNLGIIADEIECDYYDYLKNKGQRMVAEYMSQYSWAEERLGEFSFYKE